MGTALSHPVLKRANCLCQRHRRAGRVTNIAPSNNPNPQTRGVRGRLPGREREGRPSLAQRTPAPPNPAPVRAHRESRKVLKRCVPPAQNRLAPVPPRLSSSGLSHCCPVEVSAKRRNSLIGPLDFMIDGGRDAKSRPASAPSLSISFPTPIVMAAQAAIHGHFQSRGLSGHSVVAAEHVFRSQRLVCRDARGWPPARP